MPASRAARNHAEREKMKRGGNNEFSKDEVFDASCIYAKQLLSKNTDKFNKFEFNGDIHIPKLNKCDLKLGKVLGRGSFGVVQEVIGVNRNSDKSFEAKTTRPREVFDENTSNFDVNYISGHIFKKKGQPRFAIKYLSDEVMGDHTICYRAILDMALDCKFLSILNHPFILKIRAVASCGPFDQENFILLDRLEETLDRRFSSWKKKQSLRIGIGKRSKQPRKYKERLRVAHDLISAISYLHESNIIHRDLKPENIGFTYSNDLKLFDFGLAKDISHLRCNEKKLYKLTGNTGSCRYMAPEVAKSERYNQSIDVYSFSILLWQFFKLTKPYENYTFNMHQRYVVLEGHRPKVDESWPEVLGAVMKKGWSSEISKRPTAAEILSIIKHYIIQLENDYDSGSGISSHSRRSNSISGKK